MLTLKNLKAMILVIGLCLATPQVFAADQAKNQPHAAQSEPGLLDTATVWVQTQWTKIRSYWYGQQQPATAAKPALKPGQVAGAHTGTGARGVAGTTPANVVGIGTTGAVAPTAGQPPNSANTQTNNQDKTASAKNTVFDDNYTGPVITDIPKTKTGVPTYDLSGVDKIPRLGIDREEKVTRKHYAIGGTAGEALNAMPTKPLDAPDLLTQAQLMQLLKVGKHPLPPAKVKMVSFHPKGKVKREAFDQIVLPKKPENKFQIAKVTPLTPEEYKFLSGLLLYQQGDKCAVAVGLFHSLAKSPKWTAEGNYYLAMCSKKLGLTTDFLERARRVVQTLDPYYMKKILAEVSPDIPYELIEPFGEALMKAAQQKRIPRPDSPEIAGNIYYILANYGAQTGNFKFSQQFGRMVPENHKKWAEAQFLLALGEYQTGSKAKALQIQEDLIAKLNEDKTKTEFQALVALNLGRMYFQEQKFKQARESFQKVYKDHPLWLQSLQEMGWAQLQSDDFEGAIGNMYSVQAPYFNAVYKPESYVIRTIGYLNLCQYGDAYRTLTQLEKQYRPWVSKMSDYQKNTPEYLATVRKFIALKSASTEIDGLPSQVIREMVRHRDFTNLQTSLNRQIDEQALYGTLDKEVDKALSRSRWLVNSSRKRSEVLRAKIASIKKNPQMEQNRLQWNQELANELETLNGYFFQIDLFNEAKASLQQYKGEVVASADQRLNKMKVRVVKVLTERLTKMREDLARMLDNNELLRYEVFSGSGENIRYQVAGGEKGNRVPADVIPKSKSLTWDFAGEYWEDEVGHYRSSLQNNCPDHKANASL